MNEGVREGGEKDRWEREGIRKDRWEKGLDEGGGVVTYRNLQSSVMVQGAEGQLGRNCSRCGQVACWFRRPSLAHLGVLQLAKAPPDELALTQQLLIFPGI